MCLFHRRFVHLHIIGVRKRLNEDVQVGLVFVDVMRQAGLEGVVVTFDLVIRGRVIPGRSSLTRAKEGDELWSFLG